MATTKTIQSRQQQKNDFAENWVKNNPRLKQGELAIVNLANKNSGIDYYQYRLKVGNGYSTFTDLPYIDGDSVKLDTIYGGSYATTEEDTVVTVTRQSTVGYPNASDGGVYDLDGYYLIKGEQYIVNGNTSKIFTWDGYAVNIQISSIGEGFAIYYFPQTGKYITTSTTGVKSITLTGKFRVATTSGLGALPAYVVSPYTKLCCLDDSDNIKQYRLSTNDSGQLITTSVDDGTTNTFATTTDLDNKVDKYKTVFIGQGVYGFTGDGSTVTEKTIFTDGQATNISGTIPLRTTNGNITVPETPTNNTHAASKKYVDDSIPDVSGKLDKITPPTTGEYAYVTYRNGQGNWTQNVYMLGTYATAKIPLYQDKKITSDTPTADTDVANKKYVDDAVAGAGGGGSSLRTATYIIASSDSPDDAKNAADLVIQTTEDTAAKLAAITFTVDGPNPGTYYFAPGTYNVSSTTRVNCPGTYSFIGYGATINVIGSFTFGDTTNSTTADISFEGFKFTQSASNPGIGLLVDTSFYGTVNVDKCQFVGSLPVGIQINGICKAIIFDCYFNVNNAIALSTSTDKTLKFIISNCVFEDYGVAISLDADFYLPSSSLIITNNLFEGLASSSTAIYVENNLTHNAVISNNTNAVGKFIWSTTSTAREYLGIIISNNTSYPNAAAYDVCLYGIFTDVVISDNNCRYGIKLWTSGSTSTNLTVKGNVVSALSMHAGLDDYTTGSFKNVVITGNLITGQYYSNIGGSRWALNKGSVIDGNSIYRYHSSSGSYDDQFFVSGNNSSTWASTSQVMFGNNINNA